jgi:NTE family protein
LNNRPVSLALQGGGSHGAFTWGVLDRLLEDERIDFEAISGASAGAMNAVVMAHGLTIGGRDGARAALKEFWECVAAKAHFSSRPEDLSADAGDAAAQSSAAAGLESFLSMMRHFSPRQFNPLDVNPVRDIVRDQVDFERLRAECPVELFIATTQVSTGMLRLFRTRQMTLEVLLASACVPGLHHAIEIDGEAYWDGGLTANPPLFPLVHQCDARDLIMVLLQPTQRAETPTSAGEIRRRLSEISFSSAFFTELQGLALAKREAAASPFAFGRLQSTLQGLRLHAIDSPQFMSRLSATSKLNVHPEFIHALRDEGRERAGQWLEQNFDAVGTRSTFDVNRFLHWGEGVRSRALPRQASFAEGAS